MAAAIFYGTGSFVGLSGAQYSEPFTASDVSNAFVTWDSSGLTFVTFPEPVTLVDLVCTVGGTDTNKMRIWINNRDSGKTFVNIAVLNSVNNRVPLPLNFGNPRAPGAVQFQIKQLV